MRMRTWFLTTMLALLPAIGTAQSVVTYHNSLERHGRYTVSGLTLDAAAGMHIDRHFQASIKGHVYAQPLYWLPAGKTTGRVIVATESNLVYALDSVTGSVTWKTELPRSP